MDDWLAIATTAVGEHRALQKPRELAGLLELAASRDVRLVLEIGSDAGGTLWAWRQLGAEVVAVSLPNGPYGTGRPLQAHGATVVAGDSHDLGTWLEVREALDSRLADLLFVDADHTFAGSAGDLMAYAGLVRPGGLVALHDICRHQREDVAVWQVWKHLEGRPRIELVDEPATWGGIGVVVVGEGLR